MPSLGIAPASWRLQRPLHDGAAGPAPVSGVFPTGGYLHLLEVRVHAIQLSPYHAGPPAHRPIRLGPVTGFLACCFPSGILSDRGKPLDPEIFLQIPPRSIGDTTERLAAQRSCS